MISYFPIVLLLSLCCILQHTSAAVGWCYQCNSNNPRCGMVVDPSMGVDMTPCNGQCYTYMHKNIVHRGCSWEHGYMTEQTTYTAVHDKDGLWLFCNTPLCNSDASSIINNICNDDSCSYFDFPQDCEAANLYTLCGKQCGNQMC